MIQDHENKILQANQPTITQTSASLTSSSTNNTVVLNQIKSTTVENSNLSTSFEKVSLSEIQAGSDAQQATIVNNINHTKTQNSESTALDSFTASDLFVSKKSVPVTNHTVRQPK